MAILGKLIWVATVVFLDIPFLFLLTSIPEEWFGGSWNWLAWVEEFVHCLHHLIYLGCLYFGKWESTRLPFPFWELLVSREGSRYLALLLSCVGKGRAGLLFWASASAFVGLGFITAWLFFINVNKIGLNSHT